MPLNIAGITLPENLDCYKVIENQHEYDMDEVYVSGQLFWKKQKYYWIVYLANGGNGNMSTQTIPVGQRVALSKNAYSRIGYLFIGWSRDGVSKNFDDGQDVIDIISAGETLNLHALWNAITYYINYNGNGANSGSTESTSHTYDSLSRIRSNGFVRTGYLFTNWTDDLNNKYSNNQEILNLSSINSSVINLYANWSPITYYVAYNGNGADGGSTATSTHTYGIGSQLTSNGYTRSHSVFVGWSTDGSSTTVHYTNGQWVSNLTAVHEHTINLFAIWRATELAIGQDYCTEVTGGWFLPGGQVASYSGLPGWIIGSESERMCIYTGRRIDLTHISSVVVRIATNVIYCGMDIGFTDDPTGNGGILAGKVINYHTKGDIDFTIDTSNIVGEKYFKIVAHEAHSHGMIFIRSITCT